MNAGPKLPDVTPAQIGALLVTVITNALILFNFDLTDAQSAGLLGLINGLVVLAWLIVDWGIRRSRAQMFSVKPTIVVADTLVDNDDPGDAEPTPVVLTKNVATPNPPR